MQIPQSRADKLKVRDDSLIPITAEGLARLKEKLERFNASISDLAAEAKRAADYGDRSESAEYKEAKGKLRGAHRQILILKDQIKRAAIIKSGPGISGTIQLGSTVVLEKGGRQITFQIVGPYETDPMKGRISNQSPLGAALIGRAKGDEITIPTATGNQTYKVILVN